MKSFKYFFCVCANSTLLLIYLRKKSWKIWWPEPILKVAITVLKYTCSSNYMYLVFLLRKQLLFAPLLRKQEENVRFPWIIPKGIWVILSVRTLSADASLLCLSVNRPQWYEHRQQKNNRASLMQQVGALKIFEVLHKKGRIVLNYKNK